MVRTFEEIFCAQRGVPPEKYGDTMMRLTLYPLARWLRPVLALKSDYLAPDRAFIRSVGRITRFSEFDTEVRDYLIDPENRGFLRRGLKLRVSAYRTLKIVRGAMREGSAAPIGSPGSAPAH